jgi:hypothetical protein
MQKVGWILAPFCLVISGLGACAGDSEVSLEEADCEAAIGTAPVVDLGSGDRDGRAQGLQRGYRRAGLFL